MPGNALSLLPLIVCGVVLALAGCERVTSTTYSVDRGNGTGGTATFVEVSRGPPARDIAMVDAPGRSSGKGRNP